MVVNSQQETDGTTCFDYRCGMRKHTLKHPGTGMTGECGCMNPVNGPCSKGGWYILPVRGWGHLGLAPTAGLL